MAKKFSKLSLLLCGGVLLAVLYFVFGVGRREGICVPAGQKCAFTSCPANCCGGTYACRYPCQKNAMGVYECDRACVCK